MNSIERVLATIKGEKRDRPPLSLTLSLYGAKLINCPLSEYYSNPQKYVEGQIAVFNIIGPDIIFGPFSAPLFGKAFGSEIKIFKDQPPNLKKPIVQNIEDIESIDFEKAYASNEIKYFIDAIKGLVKELGKKVLIAPISLSPADLPIMILGLENWLDVVLSDINMANKLIEKTGEFFLKFTSELFEVGASFIIIPALFVNPSIITEEIVLRFHSQLVDLFAKTKGPLITHEGGAKIVPFIEIAQTLPNVAGFVVNSKDDLTIARNKLDNNQVLIGNIEGPDLSKMSKNEIEMKVEEICRKVGDDPNFIFGSSGADIPLNTPIENIKVIKNTLEQIYEI